MTEKLKPCPFNCADCSGLQVCKVWPQEKFSVYCSEHTIFGPSAKTEQEAIEAWNRRAK